MIRFEKAASKHVCVQATQLVCRM